MSPSTPPPCQAPADAGRHARRIVRVALPVPLHRLFDYAVPECLPLPVIGARVTVPFAGRRLVGICMAINPPDAHHKVKHLDTILDEENIFGFEIFELGKWLAEYYLHPLGEVWATLLPAAARKPQPLRIPGIDRWEITGPATNLGRSPRQRALYETLEQAGGSATMEALKAAGFNRTHLRALAAKGLVGLQQQAVAPPRRLIEAMNLNTSEVPDLTPEQSRVLETLEAQRGFAPALLDGITGSGKTEVYLRHIETVRRSGRQVLVLVPEIALTPQTLSRFRARFGEAAVMHSNMTDRARLTEWLRTKQGQNGILIGTRSAVLTPFKDLGLIVVDEEHDASFKQADGLRYSARDVAVKRARDLDIPLILGSATPSFESLHNALRGRYRHLRLTRRAGGAELPVLRLVDIRGQTLTGGLCETLLAAIGKHLAAGGQALVFLNRRGFAPSLMCGFCGWQARCRGCEWPMTMHRQPPSLICHHCGRRQTLTERCPECAHDALIAVGTGTQRCEATLRERFPDTPVYRIDRDTTRSQKRLEAKLEAIGRGEPAILVGTQMLAKGHHFPDVSLVAVINADGGFISPDFRAPERTAQLITQVSGRAGRAERKGVVYIQTYQPDNPLLTTLTEIGYGEFARRELESRATAELPPFQPMALVRAESVNGDDARGWLSVIAAALGDTVEVFGPAPAIMPRVADRIRYQLMVTATSRGRLHQALKPLGMLKDAPRNLRWSLDIDPYDTY